MKRAGPWTGMLGEGRVVVIVTLGRPKPMGVDTELDHRLRRLIEIPDGFAWTSEKPHVSNAIGKGQWSDRNLVIQVILPMRVVCCGI